MFVRFVDREDELGALRDWCSRFRYTPLFIYGPEGCGKTRLLREFVKKFDEYFGEGSIAIYIDAMEDRDVDRAVLSSLGVCKVVSIARICLETISDLLSASVPIGQALSRSISRIVDKVAERLGKKNLEDSYVLVVIDDVVRAIGLDKVEWYVKYLFETMNKLYEEYRPRAINFIATTSEGVSRRLVAKHRHAEIVLMWNLDRDSFEELFHELKPPDDVKFEDVWQLLGGNPGKLIELADRYSWNIDKMLRYYETRIREVVKKIAREGLIDELRHFVEDIVSAEKVLDRKMSILEDMLEEENLILYKHWVLLTSRYEIFDKAQPDIGIGRYYAWQVPMYRELVKKALASI